MSANGANNNFMKPASQLVGDVINEREAVKEKLKQSANDRDVIEDACQKITATLMKTFSELNTKESDIQSTKKSDVKFTFFLGSRESTVNTCFSAYWKKVESITNLPVNCTLISEMNKIFLTNIEQQAQNLSDESWNCQTEIGTKHLYEKEPQDKEYVRYIELHFLTIHLKSKRSSGEVSSHNEGHICNSHDLLIYDIDRYQGRKTRIEGGIYSNILPLSSIWDPDSVVYDYGEYHRKKF